MRKYVVELRTGKAVIVEADSVRGARCDAGHVLTFYVGTDVVATFYDVVGYGLSDNLLRVPENVEPVFVEGIE